MFNEEHTFELIYRASENGFGFDDFHSLVDMQGPILVVARSAEHEKVFGGYTNIDLLSNVDGGVAAEGASW